MTKTQVPSGIAWAARGASRSGRQKGGGERFLEAMVRASRGCTRIAASSLKYG